MEICVEIVEGGNTFNQDRKNPGTFALQGQLIN